MDESCSIVAVEHSV